MDIRYLFTDKAQQKPFITPYESDSATVLMHFDGNFANAGILGGYRIPFGQPDGPLYSGWMDEIKFYNHVPPRYDSTGLNIEERSSIPERITLKQNYPNPFNPTTKKIFNLPRSTEIILQVFDLIGREVAELIVKKQQAGILHHPV